MRASSQIRQSVSQLFHSPSPRSPLHRLSVRFRRSRSNTSTEYSLPGVLRPAVAAVKRSGVLGCRNENFACETVLCPRCRNENFACETQTRTLSGPPSTGASIQEDRLLLLFNTTRMVPGPPSTGDAIAMDGGMADTACYYTLYVTVHYTSICNCTAHPLSYATPESNPTLPPPPTPRSPALHRTPGCALASCTSTPCKATI